MSQARNRFRRQWTYGPLRGSSSFYGAKGQRGLYLAYNHVGSN